MWINGYQIGQVNALQRRHAFGALAGDPVLEALPGICWAFPELYKATLHPQARLPENAAGAWVGGGTLRTALAGATVAQHLVFYDFSSEAVVPLDRPGVLHCPCLALAGVVVAMSMPDPAVAPRLKDMQRGRKAGTWGRLLPGWFLVKSAAGQWLAHGPAAPAAGLALPHGCFLDEDGFLAHRGDGAP